MALYRVRPTGGDIAIANVVSKYTNHATEQIAEALTWGADEHVLAALAVGWWLYCRNKGTRDRRDSSHILLTTLSATVLPHLLKNVFDQDVIPTANIWCAQTPRLIKPMATIAPTIAGRPNKGLREKTGITSERIAKAGKMRM